MELSDAQAHLVDRLSAPQLSSEHHLRALNISSLKSLEEVAGIGLDTNILKVLRREPTLANSLLVTAQTNQTTLIAPGQCVVEYWNNHKVFASDEWSAFKSDLAKLTKRLTAESIEGHDEKSVREIERLVQELSADLEESRSPEYMRKSRGLMQELLEAATLPMVSRATFAPLADVRLSSKTPPGWADDKTKSAALGDFFGWCDFLLGSLCVTDPQNRTRFVFVSDDTKPDWRTGSSGHPALIAEFAWVCGSELSIITLDELRAMLRTDAKSEEAKAEDSAPKDEASDGRE